MSSRTNSGDFTPEKASSNRNFTIDNNVWTQISLRFNKQNDRINVECIKNNDFSNKIQLGNLTQEELFSGSNYKLFIGRLLDHTSDINIKDFRIYKNINNYQDLITKIHLAHQNQSNRNLDKHRLIVDELINRETELFQIFNTQRQTQTQSPADLQANVNLYMNDMNRLFSFKRKNYVINNNNEENFNRKICIRKKNNAGFIGLNVNNRNISGQEYRYTVQNDRSNDPTSIDNP